MERTYLNGSHRKYCEECQKANDAMSRHPLSREQMKDQCDRVEMASKKKKKK